MPDKSAPSDQSDPEPDSIDAMSRPGDVDQMVSSFLSELNTISDALELVPDKPAEQDHVSKSARRSETAVDVQPLARKPVSYRNIDVLLMDNKQFPAGEELTREELPHIAGLFESHSSAQSAGARRRRIRLVICFAASVALLGALGVLYQTGYFDSGQSSWTKDNAARSVSTAAVPAPVAVTVTPAVAVQKVSPRYPAEARRLGVEGTVEFDADVDENGRVVRTLAVSGPLMLRNAAADALLMWRFKPAQRNGVILKSTVRVSVDFSR